MERTGYIKTIVFFFLCFTFLCRKYCRTHSNGKFKDGHSKKLGKKKVAKFVYYDHNAEKQKCQKQIQQCTHFSETSVNLFYIDDIVGYFS